MKKFIKTFNVALDVENKTYVFVSEQWGIWILKHFTLVIHNRNESRWKWVNLDGKSVSNILILEDIRKDNLLYKTPADALENQLLDGSLYEFNDVEDMIKNLPIILENKND